MAIRIGREAQQRAAQLTFEPQFCESDAAEAGTLAEFKAKALQAIPVAAAAEPGFRTLSERYVARLAYLLTYIYSAGGRKREGSNASIATLAAKTGNGPRTVQRMLDDLRQLGLLKAFRRRRQGRKVYGVNRVDQEHIALLIETSRTVVSGEKSVVSGQNRRSKVSSVEGESVVSSVESGTCHPPNCRLPNSKETIRERLKTGPQTPQQTPVCDAVRWSDFVALVGEWEAERAADSLKEESVFMFDMLRRCRRREEPLPDWLEDSLMQIAASQEACLTTEGEAS